MKEILPVHFVKYLTFLISIVLFLASVGFVSPIQAAKNQSRTESDLTVYVETSGSDTVTYPSSRSNLFTGLTADPTAIGADASFVHVDMPDTELGDFTGAFVSIGGNYPLFRFGRPGDGQWQINFETGILSQFNLDAPSNDLLNTDFLVGIPVTYRDDDLSMRWRLMHQSSHLGDEFLLSGDAPERVNISIEFTDLIVSYELGEWRLYAGGLYMLNKFPESLDRQEIQGGLEYRENISKQLPGDFLGAVDVTSREETDWDPQVSAELGWNFRWSVGPRVVDFDVLLQGFDGPLPFGQFFTKDAEYYGVEFKLNV